MRIIQHDGKTLYADRYVITDSNLMFVSVYGAPQAVEGVVSAIASGYDVRVQVHGQAPGRLDSQCNVSYSDYRSCRRRWSPNNKGIMRVRPVSYGRAHGFYLDSSCILKKNPGEYVAIGKDMAAAQQKAFDALMDKPIPMLKEWKGEVLELLRDHQYLSLPDSYGCAAIQVDYRESEVLEIISKAIKTRVLPFHQQHLPITTVQR